MTFFDIFLTATIFITTTSAGGPSLDPSLVEILESSWYSIPSGNFTFWDCTYECSNKAKTPVPNPAHTPTANGCGVGSITIPKKILPKPGIETCCNQHDICYDTCNNVKSDCDDNFRDCMLRVCGSDSTCEWVADKLYTIVKYGGCPAYLIAQSNACIC